jgi:alkanesulfonate monooxygenase SsuD/methylene tetrahydromethanopterin reductase-like flavin-dependent oxidoreductase (luciferase family)
VTRLHVRHLSYYGWGVLFSVWISASTPWADTLAVARHAEATGWDGLWLADHFMNNGDGPNDVPSNEAFALLAGLAAAVPRVRIGSLVAGNTYRHPTVLAKTATTIDHISGGRMVLGIGTGWQVNEHAAYGIPLGSVRERTTWLEESCKVITSLRDNARTTVPDGRYGVTDAPLEPKPLGPLPLLIGASGQNVMARLVATYAQEWNTWSHPSLYAQKRPGFERALDKAGRDPKSLHRSTQALLFLGPDGAEKAERAIERGARAAIGGTAAQITDVVGEFAEAGLDEFIVPYFTLGPVEQTRDTLDQLMAEVVPNFR